MRIRIHLFTSMWIRIRILEAKPDPDLVPGYTLIHKKLDFDMKNIGTFM
jgi:hypothetical protein